MLHKYSLAALLTIPALALTACGSSEASENGGPADLEAAQASVDEATTLPEKITQTVPLTKAPPRDIKLAYLNCEAPGCAPSGVAVETAGTALGWDVSVITAKSATPGAALQQAIDAGNDYIILNSFNMAAVGPQMKLAKEKDITVIGTFMMDEPTGKDGNGLSAVFYNDESPAVSGRDFANWIIVDSEGEADVLMVNLPILPSNGVAAEATEEELKKNCPSCEFASLDVSFDQMASGAVPGAIVSHLKTHPDTNYVYFYIADLATGVESALQTAQLTDEVTLVGNSQAAPQLQSLVDGTSAAWNAVPLTVAWSAVDYAARDSVGEPLNEADQEKAATVRPPIIDDPAVAEEILASPTQGVWEGPEGYQEQFLELWNVD